LDTVNSLCTSIRQILSGNNDQEAVINESRELLVKFAKEPVSLKSLLAGLIASDDFLALRWPTLDENEITVYRDSGGLFSLRLYVWDPARTYPVHDHGSWGVVVCLAGEIHERKFERIDDGHLPGFAKIKEKSSLFLKSGDTTTVLPLNDGIHQMDSVSEDIPSITLHLYGRAVRNGFVKCFNMQKNSVYRMVTPKMFDRYYAIKAMSAIGEDWCKELLTVAAKDKKPFVRLEALAQLARIDKEAALKALSLELKKVTELKDDFLDLINTLQ